MSGLLFPREALAYGLGKAPPASGHSNRRTEEEIRRARDAAERLMRDTGTFVAAKAGR